MISLQHITKRYGDFTAVDDLTLEVQPGEVFAFLGPNGAGKTTIRMLTGILVPSSGSASIAGLRCHAEREQVMRLVGYLPDTPTFYDFLTGRELLVFVGRMHGFSRDKAEARADALLDSLALRDAATDYAVNYSLGMRKKLVLACALIHRPQVVARRRPANGHRSG